MARVIPEKESRRRIILLAQQHGTEEAVLKLFDRYDRLMSDCKTAQEREALAAMGVMELSKSIFCDLEPLEINGKIYR
jgi:hypothetical protein